MEKRLTISNLHHEKLLDIKNEEARLPELKYKLDKLEILLQESEKLFIDIPLIKNGLEDLGFTDVEPNFIQISFTVDQLKNDIKEIENGDKEINYLMKVQNIFKKINVETETESSIRKSNGIYKYVNIESRDRKGDIMDEYLEIVGKKQNVKKNDVPTICSECDSDLKSNAVEAMLFCTNCGLCFNYWDIDTPQWSNEVEVKSEFSYKRQNHFQMHLKRLQAKESTDIPQSVINRIMSELDKNRIHSMNGITKKYIKKILKTCKLSSYYNNINRIMSILTGQVPPNMPAELEDTLIMMFEVIQEPYIRHKPPSRKNFLSYPYVINKMLNIITEENPSAKEFIPNFQILKSRDKKSTHDKIWKKICIELNWTFHPSF